jgi:RNA polymerase primary sigma factor
VPDSLPPVRFVGGVESPLTIYLRQINETPLLGAAEERELARRTRAGDAAARDCMVRANLRLVVSIARAYNGRGLPLPDLIEEGNVGLLRAVGAFDPGMNTRFCTYATYWIKQAIRLALLRAASPVRVPPFARAQLRRWSAAAARLEGELGRRPDEEEVARALGLSRRRLKVLRRALRALGPAQQAGAGDGEQALEELLPDERTSGPAVALARADTLRQVLAALDALDPRQAMVLRLRFGLNGEEPHTLTEVGSRLGVTRERVRQIERQALRVLGRKCGADG